MADIGTVASLARLMAATRELPLHSPDEIINNATQYRTYTCKRILERSKNYFQGGTKIIARLQLKVANRTRNYLPTETQTPSSGEALASWEIPWRFRITDSVWNEHEVELNMSSPGTKLADIAKSIRQEMFTDFWNMTETKLWAPPLAEMETGNSAGVEWYSIPAIITKAGGPPQITGDGADANFSTIFGVNTTTYPNFKNNFGTYDAASPETTLLNALESMFIDCMWESPDSRTGLKETKQSSYEIVTNKEGYLLLCLLAREMNQQMHPPHNLAWELGKVSFNGIPIRRCDAITTTTAAVGYPIFYFLNYDCLKFCFRQGRYLKPIQFGPTVNQPFNHVEYRDTWGNLYSPARRELGVVYGV